MITDRRKANEIAHGKRIAPKAEKIWFRDTPAGQKRMEHRFADAARFLALPKGAKLLELGAGTGTWTAFLARLPLQVTSVELSEDLLQVARQRLTSPSIEWVAGDAEQMPFKDETFDAVCGLSVLHHLVMEKVVPEIHRVLKPGGLIWFSEPNMLNPQIFIQKNVPIIKKWLGDTPDETAFFRWPLKNQLARAGFSDLHVIPFDFLHPSVPVSWTNGVDWMSQRLERMPLIREIGGSLLIHGRKAAAA